MNSNYQPVENQNRNKLIEKLIRIAAQGLNESYLPDQKEFVSKRKIFDNKFLSENKNARYTLINLIGLHKAETYDLPIEINTKNILIHHIANVDKLKGIGDLGLLLWATSLVSPADIPKILTKINFNSILESYDDAKKKLTTELAWFLIGILMASTFSEVFKKSTGDLIQKIYSDLRNNYGASGIFRHQLKQGFSGKLRAEISTFSDQIYPIYALSLYGKQVKNEEALLISKECALKLCELQGKDGEWMWHYNSKNGSVINKYPVFSVNQFALAPFVLSSLQKASNTDFSHFINKGMDWGLKSSQKSLIDDNKKILWDGISQNKSKRILTSSFNFLKNSNIKFGNKNKLVKECSSYNYGWILHALVGKTNDSNTKFKVDGKQNNSNNIFILN